MDDNGYTPRGWCGSILAGADPPILGLVLWYMHLDQAQLEIAHNAHVSPWDLSPASCT
jgi:hypothetical protein